ncbi:MAG: hypothetical protein KC609_17345, partial [Myxococcales bacterium]|nr:hypothetical protein [Myxococcales bacterium]
VARNYLVYFLFFLFFSAISGVGIAYFSHVPDWFMFVLMYVVQIISALLYIKAFYRERTLSRLAFATIGTFLFAFWIWVLYDRIQPRWVFLNEQLVLREEIPMLWVPIIASGIAIAMIWIHALYLASHGAPDERNGKSKEEPREAAPESPA